MSGKPDRSSLAEERPMIHTRLPRALVKEIDHISIELDLDRARTIERLIQYALPKATMADLNAIEAYP